MSKYSVNDKVWFIVAESSPLGGGRHKGVTGEEEVKMIM